MNLISRAALLALGPMAGAVCRAAGAAALADGATALGRALAERLTDSSRRASDALAAAVARAWDALEAALAEEPTLAAIDRADDRAFRGQVRLFLLDAQFDGRAARDPGFRSQCLLELRAARSGGAFDGRPDVAGAVGRLGDLTAFSDPAAEARHQREATADLAAALRARGFPALADLVGLRPAGGGDPLLAVAVRYYFRRAVEADPRLFQGFAFSQLELIGRAQDDAANALTGVRDRLDALHKTLRDQDLPLAEEIVEVPEPSVADRFREHTNGVLAVSPDGALVLGGSKYDGKLRLFDSRTGKELRRLPGHAGWVTNVCFSLDGKQALSTGQDGSAKLWEVATGRLVRTWVRANDVRFADDGRVRFG